MKAKKAELISQIPEERVRSIDGSIPKIGDLVVLDQGFTFDNGDPGCIVYGLDKNGKYIYEAEVYESEIGDSIDT